VLLGGREVPVSRFPLIVLLAGCTGGVISDGDTDTDADPFAAYDGADLRITAPGSGDLLFLEEEQHFAAEVRDSAGGAMAFDEIAWTSSADAAWLPTGATFSEPALVPGMHEITAEASLPNGDRVAHTIGGVRVQSKWAGTYAGLFTSAVHTEYQNTPITVTCTGAATLTVDLLGEHATGTSDCLLSLNGVDVPASYLFELDNDDGELTGTANLDLLFTEVPYEATGSIDPETFVLTIAFAGDIPVVGTVEGGVDADRVSLDVTE
jgi:hypothetical protein